jgi:large-conductance mechanosensitive channel
MAGPTEAVKEGANLVLVVVVYALIIGTLLASTVFSSLTIINTTSISTSYGAFVTAILAFLTIGGTIIGIVWLLKYVKGLFDKKSGLNGMTA